MNELLDLQRQICQDADVIRDELKPKARDLLVLEKQEFDRVYDIVKVAETGKKQPSERITSMKTTISTSMVNFGTTTKAIAARKP